MLSSNVLVTTTLWKRTGFMHPAHLIQLIMARRQMHSGSGKTVLIRICIRSIASVSILPQLFAGLLAFVH
jgi:hypothetical protein